MIDYISENKIVSLIKEAHHKLAVISPALSIGVAEAIRDKVREDILENISVIVDLDANVYRMGFGDENSLDLLKEFLDNGRINIGKQKGLRVGVIVSDDKVLFYAPTAKMVEVDPISENGTSLLNGFMMTDDIFCNQTQSQEKTSPIATAIINEVEGNSETGQDPTIGIEEIKEEDIKQEQKSLEEIPPKRFDIQRRIDIYTSKLTFVEFTISFEKYSVKKINIPKSITIVKDKQVGERLLSQLALFQEMKDFHTAIPKDILEKCNPTMKKELSDLAKDKKGQNSSARKSTDGVDMDADDALCETSIKAMGDWIRNNYTIHINDEYGNAMLFKDKGNIQSDLSWLQSIIDHYHDECAKELMRRSAEVIDRFAKILLPIAKENPSPKLQEEIYKRQLFEEVDDIIRSFIRGELASEVMKITSIAEKKSIDSKRIKAIFKNISFDSINNEDEFLDKLKPPFVAKFGEEKFNELFHIEEVAQEK